MDAVNTTVDDFVHTPAGHRVRLKVQYSEAGVFIGLYAGEGTISGRAGVCYWRIHEIPSLQRDLAIFGLRTATLTGEPADETALFLDNPLVHGRVGNSADDPNIIENIIATLMWWREYN